MKIAVIGDNCIDLYEESGLYYETGNVVDTGASLIHLGHEVAIITTIGTDDYSTKMESFLESYGFDTSHVTKVEGKCAITYMSMEGNERVHGEYDEGVLENIKFTQADIEFAAKHHLVHSALWGKAENILTNVKELGTSLISFDYADRLDHEIIDKTIEVVDYGFFSYHGVRDEEIEMYLKDKVNRGLKVAIATMGENGSLAYDGQQFYQYGIVESEVVNTVGAGDSFIAGFLSGIINGNDITASLAKGAHLASKIVNRFEPWIPKEERK